VITSVDYVFIIDYSKILADGLRLVFRKTSMVIWFKVNTNGSVKQVSADCGGLFCDYTKRFCDDYAHRVYGKVFHIELTAKGK
jgi:hypothetical protein